MSGIPAALDMAGIGTTLHRFTPEIATLRGHARAGHRHGPMGERADQAADEYSTVQWSGGGTPPAAPGAVTLERTPGGALLARACDGYP